MEEDYDDFHDESPSPSEENRTIPSCKKHCENLDERDVGIKSINPEYDSSISSYKFAESINSGEIDKLAEEEFLARRSIYPNYVEVDKAAISQALANLKVELLEEKHRCSELLGKTKLQLFCGICLYVMNQRSTIIKHLRVHFKMFWCNPCESGPHHHHHHQDGHHHHDSPDKPGGVWVCDVCNKSLKSEHNLSLHKKSHNTLYCDQCDFNCEGRKRLTVHMNRKHMRKNDSHVCHICNKSLSTSQQLKYHLQIHGHEEFRCEYCGKLFKVEKNMQKHIMINHKEKKFICEWCGMTFSVKCHHDKHVLLKHTKNKEFNCSICEYKGATKYYLKKHMEIHEDAKYPCTHCGKTFRQPGALRSHTMTHTGERPYACTDCTYRCIQPYDLRKHFLKQHNKVIERPGLYLDSNVDIKD